MPVDVENVTLAERSARQQLVTPATKITWLIDNAEAYAAVIAACRAARESIWMTQLAFDADCVAYSTEEPAADAIDDSGTLISHVLLDAASKRGVNVRILLNASLLLNTARPLREYFASAGAAPELVRVRGVSRFPQLLHAKIVVIDQRVAFLVGSPFANGYWDDSRHAPVDLRRPTRELGGRPLHDLSMQVEDDAAATLGSMFCELWNSADDVVVGDVETLCVATTPVDDPSIRLLQSSPRATRAVHPPERAEILPALLAGISMAKRLIYIEHQYLSSIAVIDALTDALAREQELELIVVLNQNPDVTAYRGWQNRRLASSGLFDHPRVGLFSLWTVAPSTDARLEINQVFVHSKVVTVDDCWAMVGSANLDGVSLSTYGEDFSGWLGQRVFRGVRNFDVAAILSASDDSSVAASVLELRTGLWREHLDAPDLDATDTPPDGWLAHWRRHATQQARSLSSGLAADSSARMVVLPYSQSSTPVRQLCDAGVTLASERLDVRFDPSWVEVHLSPNWFRNMFT